MSMTDFHPNYVQSAIDGEISNLARAANGQRNETLFRSAASLASLGVPVGEIIRNLKPSADGIGIKGSEFYTTIKSGVRKGRACPRPAASGVSRRPHVATTHRPDPVPVAPQVVVAHSGGLPARTAPGTDGKPTFVRGGDGGPQVSRDEIRRHVYVRDQSPVRMKIKRTSGGWVNWYRVNDVDNGEGWQAAKPSEYIPCPYVRTVDPFDAEMTGDVIYWPEGEKDVDVLGMEALPAFTFGGTGDGLPEGAAEIVRGRHVIILADNDVGGRSHAQKKAALAFPVAASVKIVEFTDLPEKGDVADYIQGGNRGDDLRRRAETVAAWSPPLEPSQDGQSNITEDRGLVVRRASDIAIEPIEWAWQNRIAIGKQTLIVGEPGLGKSQLTTFLAAAITTGGPWPCGEGNAPLGSVIILSAEDDAADTILPRLIAAGADVSRVLIVSSVRDGKNRRSFNLQADLDLLQQEISKVGDVRLVIIDPISSYMGKSDSHKNADVRSVLEPVGEMAARLRVAVVSVTHKSKGKGGSAINAAIGSIGFTGVVRAAFMVEKDPDDADRRLFLQIKNNIARDAGGLAFRIGQHMIDGGIVASAIYWDAERVTCTADEVLAANESGSDRSTRTEAEEFLSEFLASGPRPQKEVKEHAEGADISWATIKRAKKALGVKADRVGGAAGTGRWEWSLPPKGLKNPYVAHLSDVSPLAKIEPLSDQEAL